MPIHGFGPSFAHFKWALVGRLGLALLWGALWILDFNIYVVFGPQHNASDILDLNI